MPRGKRQEGNIRPNQGVLSHDEVLEILSEQARHGSVTAASALERALRARERDEKESLEDELDRILTK